MDAPKCVENGQQQQHQQLSFEGDEDPCSPVSLLPQAIVIHPTRHSGTNVIIIVKMPPSDPFILGSKQLSETAESGEQAGQWKSLNQQTWRLECSSDGRALHHLHLILSHRFSFHNCQKKSLWQALQSQKTDVISLAADIIDSAFLGMAIVLVVISSVVWSSGFVSHPWLKTFISGSASKVARFSLNMLCQTQGVSEPNKLTG